MHTQTDFEKKIDAQSYAFNFFLIHIYLSDKAVTNRNIIDTNVNDKSQKFYMLPVLVAKQGERKEKNYHYLQEQIYPFQYR